MEQDWERTRNNRITQDETAALPRIEEKIAKTLQSTQNLEELKKDVTQILQELRAEFICITAEIRKGLRNLSPRRPTPKTSKDYFREQPADQNLLRKETGLDLNARLETHETFLSSGNRGKVPPKEPKAATGDPDDSDSCIEPSTRRRRPSSMPLKKQPVLVNEEEAIAGFAKLHTTA